MKNRLERNKATLYGIIAILLWSTIVGLIRNVSENFGPAGGAALVYTVGSIILILCMGWPKLHLFSKAYLLVGSILFVGYEVCFVMALGLANDRAQAIELGMVNYLWPSFTILFAGIINRHSFSIKLIIGLCLSMTGLAWVMSGSEGLSITKIIENIQSNPISYVLAFIGAILWALYSNVTKLMSRSQNGMALFFILTTAVFWSQFLIGPQPEMHVSTTSIMILLMAGVATGAANAIWTLAVIKGNVSILGILSYFTPIISTAFSSLLLSTTLSFSFWQGVAMVTTGSIICWMAMRN